MPATAKQAPASTLFASSNADPQRDAIYYEYTAAANPIGAKLIPSVPYHCFPASLYATGPSQIVRLDLADELECSGPATSPGLCASFIRVLAGENLALDHEVTSQVAYVMTGRGSVTQNGARFDIAAGDFFALPGGSAAQLEANELCQLYYVTDAPLLRYLGVRAVEPRFTPTLYPTERAQTELAKAAADQYAAKRSRISILLGNPHFPQTRTVTHVLWAMFGIVPPHAVQKPHRHQSVALDFIIDCPPGCHTLVGTQVDTNGEILHPTKVNWEPGMAFVTPPGYWHAHYNTSSQPAYLIPIQDAGLQTYLRSLDIRFID